MRRLFWRIFGLFWVATVVLILAITWITSNNFENEKLPVHDVTRMDLGAQRRIAQRATRVSRKRRGGDEAARARHATFQRRHVRARCGQRRRARAQRAARSARRREESRAGQRRLPLQPPARAQDQQHRRQTGLHRRRELHRIAAAAHAVSPAEYVLDARRRRDGHQRGVQPAARRLHHRAAGAHPQQRAARRARRSVRARRRSAVRTQRGNPRARQRIRPDGRAPERTRRRPAAPDPRRIARDALAAVAPARRHRTRARTQQSPKPPANSIASSAKRCGWKK